MISAKLIASSTPGMAKARSCIMEPIIPFESANTIVKKIRSGAGETGRTLLYHLLDGAGRIDLHREEVVEPVHFRRVLRELLTECVRQVVRRVSGLLGMESGI
jgi:hypothetical protein